MVTIAKPMGLHVTSDYPGPFSPAGVTVAVKDLIEAAREDLDALVLVPRRDIRSVKGRIICKESCLYVSKFDPLSTASPSSAGGSFWPELVERYLCSTRRPSFVHSHKLSYEARIGNAIAKQFGVPHLITVRGSSDTNSRNHWPWTDRAYRDLLCGSQKNFWLSVWAQAFFASRIGYRISPGKDIDFPNAVPAALSTRMGGRSSAYNPASLVCVCRLDDYQQKGIPCLLESIAAERQIRPELSLDLIGPCSPRNATAITRIVASLGLAGAIALLGPMTRQQVMERLHGYAGLVMLGERETFGLVYAEAAVCGVPFVFLRNSGVDGHHFANVCGIGCDRMDVPTVRAAVRELLEQAPEIRRRIVAARGAGLLHTLTAAGQSKSYVQAVLSTLNLP